MFAYALTTYSVSLMLSTFGKKNFTNLGKTVELSDKKIAASLPESEKTQEELAKIAQEVKLIFEKTVDQQSDLSKKWAAFCETTDSFQVKIVVDPKPKSHVCAKSELIDKLRIITAHPIQ